MIYSDLLALSMYISGSGWGSLIATTDPLHIGLKVWCSFVACFWSYSSKVKFSDGYDRTVLLDSVPCFFSEAAIGEISAVLGSIMILLLHTNFSSLQLP